MDKVLAIIKREYLTRVRSKGFIIGTILSPLLMASFVFVPMLIFSRGERATHRITVLDRSDDPTISERAKQELMKRSDDPQSKADRYEITIERPAESQLAEREQQLNREISDKQLEAWVDVPPDILGEGKIRYHARNVSDFMGSRRIESAYSKAVIERRMAKEGIDPEKVNRLSREVDLETINERGEKETGQSFILAYALLMIIYITTLVYGIMVMRGVVEEKQSRIIEVLLSSVRPYQLMLGKLFGIGMVALTQYITWAVFGVVISAVGASQAFAFGNFKMPRIEISVMIYFVLFFLLGYFLYATLYLVVGAIVSSEEDGQQMQMPVTMSIIVPMVVSSSIVRNPDSVFATIMSLIPIFSPILMFLRITIKQPPFWQIALSIVLLVATIFGVVWLAAKIYRVGVLMYGKRPTLPELAKWLKYS